MLINRSAVKDYVSQATGRQKNGSPDLQRFRVSDDLFAALDEEITMHLNRAIKRAEENGRTTIKGRDL